MAPRQASTRGSIFFATGMTRLTCTGICAYNRFGSAYRPTQNLSFFAECFSKGALWASCVSSVFAKWGSAMLEFPSRAEQFRAKAAGCFARSRGLHDPTYQRIFYELAIEWLAMAAEADGSRPNLGPRIATLTTFVPARARNVAPLSSGISSPTPQKRTA